MQLLTCVLTTCTFYHCLPLHPIYTRYPRTAATTPPACPCAGCSSDAAELVPGYLSIKTGEDETIAETTTVYNVTSRSEVMTVVQSSCETMAYRDADATSATDEAQLRLVPYWQGRYSTAVGAIESLPKRADGWNVNPSGSSTSLSPSTTTALYLWDVTNWDSFLRVQVLSVDPAESVYNTSSSSSEHMSTATLSGYPLWRMAGVELRTAVTAASPGATVCASTNATHPMRRSQLRKADRTSWTRIHNATTGIWANTSKSTQVVLEYGCVWSTYTAPCGVTPTSTVTTLKRKVYSRRRLQRSESVQLLLLLRCVSCRSRRAPLYSTRPHPRRARLNCRLAGRSLTTQ